MGKMTFTEYGAKFGYAQADTIDTLHSNNFYLGDSVELALVQDPYIDGPRNQYIAGAIDREGNYYEVIYMFDPLELDSVNEPSDIIDWEHPDLVIFYPENDDYKDE